MTKKEFCKTIIDTVNNMNSVGESREKQVTAMMLLLSPLKPKDLKKFAKWGYPEHHSTQKECWD